MKGLCSLSLLFLFTFSMSAQIQNPYSQRSQNLFTRFTLFVRQGNVKEATKLLKELADFLARKYKQELANANIEIMGLRKAATQAKEKPTVAASQEVQKQLTTAEAQIEKEKEVVRELVSTYKQLPTLNILKKRVKKEFGKDVLKKMSTEDGELKIEDLMSAPILKAGALEYDEATGEFKRKTGEVVDSPELMEAKITVEQLMAENKKLKEQCEEKKEVSEEKSTEETDELTQLRTENDELKKKLKGSGASEESDVSVLKAQVESLQNEIATTKENNASLITFINDKVSNLLGSSVADALTNKSDKTVDQFFDMIDVNNQFIQRILENHCPVAQE